MLNDANIHCESKKLYPLRVQFFDSQRIFLLLLYGLVKCCIVVQQNTEKQLEDVKELQGKLKQMSTEARDKDLLYNQLVCIVCLVIIECDRKVDSRIPCLILCLAYD